MQLTPTFGVSGGPSQLVVSIRASCSTPFHPVRPIPISRQAQRGVTEAYGGEIFIRGISEACGGERLVGPEADSGELVVRRHSRLHRGTDSGRLVVVVEERHIRSVFKRRRLVWEQLPYFTTISLCKRRSLRGITVVSRRRPVEQRPGFVAQGTSGFRRSHRRSLFSGLSIPSTRKIVRGVVEAEADSGERLVAQRW